MDIGTALTAEEAAQWEPVWKVLDHHKKKFTPQHALNRLFHEQRSDGPHLTPSTATVQKQFWSIHQLDRTIRKDSVTTGPAMLDVPIVVVRWDGKDYLIDGRRRVNTWVKKGSQKLHDVLLIQPR